MISCIEECGNKLLEELIGACCYVRDFDGNMSCCNIKRVDMFISFSGVGVKAYLESNKTNVPLEVTLENYHTNTSYSPIGFLTPMSYAKFYSELG